MIRFLCSIMIFALCTVSLSGQTTVVVLDEESKLPIQDLFAYSNSADSEYSALSDQEGRLTLPVLDSLTVVAFTHARYSAQSLLWLVDFSHGDSLLFSPVKTNLSLITIRVNPLQDKQEELLAPVELIEGNQIRASNPASAASLLEETGGVFVQRSQQGGGSPVLRGMEANRVLLLIDGVRMNNAIYRGGHLQNAITVDPSVLDKVIILYGPGSLIHGSDAMGGVVSYETKRPKIHYQPEWRTRGSFGTWANTATEELSQHLSMNIAQGRWGYLGSLSSRSYGDLRIGRNRNKEQGGWGLFPEYVKQLSGEDQVIDNTDPSIMKGTGYSQVDWMQKFFYHPNDSWFFRLNVQSSASSNIARFDRLNDYRDGQLRFAQWDYGPQRRFLASFSTSYSEPHRFFDIAENVFSFQRIEESRIKREFGSLEQDNQLEQLVALQVSLDFRKLFPKGDVQYGLQYWHNGLDSSAFRRYVDGSQANEVIASRYPDQLATMASAAAYFKYAHEFATNWKLRTGLRYTYINRQLEFLEDSVSNPPFFSDRSNSAAVSAFLGLNYSKGNHWVSLSLSNGFRAPNIDDTAKLFDPFSGLVVVPNSDVKPEYSYTADLQAQLAKEDKFQIHGAIFGSWLSNLLRRQPFEIEGQDSIVFDGVNSAVFANQNTSKAIIAGGYLQLKMQLYAKLETAHSIQYTYGRDVEQNNPLGHIPPVFGRSSLAYSGKSWTTKLSMNYNLQKSIDHYSPFAEDKPEEALTEGTPGWFALDWEFNSEIGERLFLSGGVYNLTDLHYRSFSSGISGAGRSVRVGVYVDF